MKILSIDTASDICGVSILEDENLICNLDSNTGRTHSENLMPMVENAFSKSNLSLKDVDLLVCDKGPGSFTGIRIGVATVMAFHDSFDIPCVGISSLESLAYNTRNVVKNNSYVCSIIDCKNDNCYFALYENKNGIFEELIEPQTESIESALLILDSYFEDGIKNNDSIENFENTTISFVGGGCKIYKDKIKNYFRNASFVDDILNNLNSYNLGLAGLVHYNENIDIGDVLPLYLKKPQAQRLLEEKEKIESNK